MKANQVGLDEDIASLQSEIDQRVKDIALKWGKKEDVIRKRVQNATTYKSNRSVSIYNAIVHHVSEIVNRGKGENHL